MQHTVHSVAHVEFFFKGLNMNIGGGPYGLSQERVDETNDWRLIRIIEKVGVI